MLLLTLLSKKNIIFCFTNCPKVFIFIYKAVPSVFSTCKRLKENTTLSAFNIGESSSANIWRPLYMVREARRGRSIPSKPFPTKYFYKSNSSGCGIHHSLLPYRSRENCCLHSNSEDQLCHDHHHRNHVIYIYTHQ